MQSPRFCCVSPTNRTLLTERRRRGRRRGRRRRRWEEEEEDRKKKKKKKKRWTIHEVKVRTNMQNVVSVSFFRVFSHSTVPKLLLIFEAAGCIRLQNLKKR